MHGKDHSAGVGESANAACNRTHIPIPHAAVVETLIETLSHRHIAVVREEFAVSSDGMEMLGYSTSKLVSRDADLRLGFGTRTTNDSG